MRVWLSIVHITRTDENNNEWNIICVTHSVSYKIVFKKVILNLFIYF